MRLQTLQIKNFISIKQASVDFEQLNDGVFLISGPTGSGKSSMLDAIHWALFGKTLNSNRASITKEIRSTYAPANEDTTVVLTFNQDKVNYKVIRTLKKDGGSAVQFYVPGKIYDKVKEANEKLEEIIGLSVKQFDQMVMLEQGNFSKFLLSDSKTRAEVLRDIFDTQLFKDIELRFKDKCSELKSKILSSTELEQNLLQGEMLETVESKIIVATESMKSEQERLTELRRRNEAAYTMLPDMVTYEQEESVYQKAQKELQELETLKPEIESLYRKREVYNTYAGILDWYDRYQQLQDDLVKAEEEAQSYRSRISSIVIDEDLSNKVAKLQSRQTELGVLLDAFGKVERLDSKIETYKQELIDYEETLRKEAEIIDACADEYNKLSERIQIREAFEAEKTKVLLQNKKREELKNEIQILEQYIQDNRRIYTKYLTKKLLNVSEKGICPVCGAPFTEEHMIEETTNAVEEFEAKQSQLDALKVRLQDTPELEEPSTTESVDFVTLVQMSNDCHTKRDKAKVAWDKANNMISSIQASISVIEKEKQSAAEITANKDKSALELELKQVSAEHQELWAKVDDNEMAKRSKNMLEGYLNGVNDRIEVLKKKIQDAEQNPEAAEECSDKLTSTLKHRDEIVDYKLNINEYLYKIQQYEMLRDNLMSVQKPVNPHPGYSASSCKQEIADTNIGIDESVKKIAEYNNTLENTQELVKRIKHIRDVRKADTETYDQVSYIYNLLSGKNNAKISFETFILHRQLEWILQSSNQYLHTLSGGQFELQVRWESTSGRTQGGLEITITDHFSGSTRPAQTFSGGELFMLSLSLSMGLMTAIDSMFTKHELNLLFIDEGFGSLDQECLNRTLITLQQLRNINSVGIISHVQDLIDTIPQGFTVEKTPAGSKIKMFKNI